MQGLPSDKQCAIPISIYNYHVRVARARVVYGIRDV